MYKRLFTIIAFFSFILTSCENDKAVTKLSDGTKIINSSTLIETKGYQSKTPVEVYVKDVTVLKVVTLPNTETPSYFRRISTYLIPLYENKSIEEALEISKNLHVDGCSGATYSARSVQKNINAALEHISK